MSAIQRQKLEIYKAKPGANANDLRAALKKGEETIGEEYLKWMKTQGLIADVSFVFENNDEVFLISYYAGFEKPKDAPKASIESLAGMNEYQKTLEIFFGDAKPIQLDPSNSFWVGAKK